MHLALAWQRDVKKKGTAELNLEGKQKQTIYSESVFSVVSYERRGRRVEQCG